MYLAEVLKDIDRNEKELRMIRHLLLRWPSSIVCRSEIVEFSGGLLSPRTLANLDSKKEGIEKIPTIGGRKACYEAAKAALFIVDRMVLD